MDRRLLAVVVTARRVSSCDCSKVSLASSLTTPRKVCILVGSMTTVYSKQSANRSEDERRLQHKRKWTEIGLTMSPVIAADECNKSVPKKSSSVSLL